nr:FkbM family methyltransferase [Rhodopirellula sp. SM50]
MTLRNPAGEVTVTPRRLGRRLAIRPGTTDLQVVREIFSMGVYALHPLRKMCPQFAPRQIADCGAYAGYSSCYFADRYPDAKVLAVEPQSDNFALMTRNTAQFSNIEPINKALWYKTGTVSLGNPAAEKWGFEFEDAGPTTDAQAPIPTITIPEIIEWAGGEIDLLKIDVEGAEREVFQRECEWLDHVGVLIIEVHDGTRPGCSRAVWKQLIERDFCMLNQHENLVLVNETLLKGFRQRQARETNR